MSICVAFLHFHRIISMERSKYISLVTELRQIAVARALVLLNDKEDAEDVVGEVLLRLWERHEDLRENTDEVRHLADRMTRNLALDLLRRRRRHPILRIFHRREKDDVETFNIPDDSPAELFAATVRVVRYSALLLAFMCFGYALMSFLNVPPAVLMSVFGLLFVPLLCWYFSVYMKTKRKKK